MNNLLKYLYSLERRGIKVGLEHTIRLLDSMGNPHYSFPSIHVAGTNGKGSTCAMIASILREAGYRTGLYTSPHLIRFNERIRINGVPIPDEEIVEFIARYRSIIDEIESTFFEATTAMAFRYFARQGADIAVVETGLGGRLDSTNVLKPVLSVITPVDVDHTELLGETVEEIAFEKGGIIKEGTPLVMAEQAGVVKAVLMEIARQKSTEMLSVNYSSLTVLEIDEGGTEFEYGGVTYRTALIGIHQALNAALAVKTVQHFNPDISVATIRKGLLNVFWPGRLQKMNDSIPVYYDVAHNAHGIRSVLHTLSSLFHEKPVGILALKADRDLDHLASVLKDSFSELIATTVPDAGVMSAEELEKRVRALGISCRKINEMSQALEILKHRIDGGKPGLILGSHYIAKAVYHFFDFSFDNGFI